MFDNCLWSQTVRVLDGSARVRNPPTGDQCARVRLDRDRTQSKFFHIHS